MSATAEAQASTSKSGETKKPDQDNLITIPYIDVREKGPLALLETHKQNTIELLDGGRNMFGIVSKFLAAVFLPLGDFLSKRWLKKTNNPYREEILKSAKIVGKKGIVALNMSYEFACTTGAFDKGAEKAPQLVRILDWAFPKLGHTLVVAHQTGPAGDFHNVTWPGVSGVFNACAEGRFAAAINQAPMRRHLPGVVYSWFKNRYHVNKSMAIPPAHLLRQVFENAKDYTEAKKILSETPITLPVLYTLTGTKPGEGCVIERLENQFIVREMQNGRVTVANHFESSFNGAGHGWMPRTTDSHDRACLANTLTADQMTDNFDWFVDPIANSHSRLVVTSDAATGKFAVVGTAGAKIVTNVFKN